MADLSKMGNEQWVKDAFAWLDDALGNLRYQHIENTGNCIRQAQSCLRRLSPEPGKPRPCSACGDGDTAMEYHTHDWENQAAPPVEPPRPFEGKMRETITALSPYPVAEPSPDAPLVPERGWIDEQAKVLYKAMRPFPDAEEIARILCKYLDAQDWDDLSTDAKRLYINAAKEIGQHGVGAAQPPTCHECNNQPASFIRSQYVCKGCGRSFERYLDGSGGEVAEAAKPPASEQWVSQGQAMSVEQLRWAAEVLARAAGRTPQKEETKL